MKTRFTFAVMSGYEQGIHGNRTCVFCVWNDGFIGAVQAPVI